MLKILLLKVIVQTKKKLSISVETQGVISRFNFDHITCTNLFFGMAVNSHYQYGI